MNKITQLEKRVEELERIIFGIDDIKDVHPIINKTLRCVSKATDLKVKLIVSRSRKRPLVEARQMAIAIMREHSKMSLSDIGAVFGGRDHSTTIHLLKLHKTLMVNDHRYGMTFLEALKSFKEK